MAAGILRSADGGNTWSLISRTDDVEQAWARRIQLSRGGLCGLCLEHGQSAAGGGGGLAGLRRHAGECCAARQQLRGLYYSSDSGATWHLATITDGSGNYVQGPLAAFASPDGNAATSVVWNPVRQLFMAAVRFHGYYQSTDGVTWTRMTAQPGSGLSALLCPTNPGGTGSIACPIFRGTLAVNPSTGDTFAWTVDVNNQDQGLWQDQCALSGGSVQQPGVTFGKQWSTAALETSTAEGAATIANGELYAGAGRGSAGLGAGQDTLLLAGANDLWKCSLAMGCVWRNTTNSTTCKSAQVGEFQHALAWNAANPLEVFVGNDSGLWRSTDAIGESGQVCSGDDASHFQNLNGSLGSLAEVVSLSPVIDHALHDDGRAGSERDRRRQEQRGHGRTGRRFWAATAARWPSIRENSANWYVNNQAGVSIYLCAQSAACTAADFGTEPGGRAMRTWVEMGTRCPCRRRSWWIRWTRRNCWSEPAGCGADRRMEAAGPGAMPSAPFLTAGHERHLQWRCADSLHGGNGAPGGGERVYLGMYGSADGGANLAGHVLSATVQACVQRHPGLAGSDPGPVTNDSNSLNKFGMDISSIFIDPHDPTGNTVYVTVEGAENASEAMQRGLQHHRRRCALDGSDGEPARGACQQHRGGPAERQYGLHCHGRGSFFHNPGGELRGGSFHLLVSVWNRIARCARGCAQRFARRSNPAGIGGGDLRARHLANTALVSWADADSRYCESRGTDLCRPDVRNHKQRADGDTAEHGQHRL